MKRGLGCVRVGVVLIFSHIAIVTVLSAKLESCSGVLHTTYFTDTLFLSKPLPLCATCHVVLVFSAFRFLDRLLR